MAVVVIAIGTDTIMAMAMKITKMRQNNLLKSALTDLHTHILPSVDDGAEHLQMALEMLRLEKKMGVERVALTPHFYPMREELDTFLARRQQAYSSLLSHWDEETMPRLRIGAEVRYSPELVRMDLHQLTIEKTRYLLLELPDVGVAPYVKQVVDIMLTQGITPILAHVERCAVFYNEPAKLAELVQMGALAQIDVKTLMHGCNAGFAKMCLKNGLAHIIASDIHNLTDRASCLGDAAAAKYKDILDWAEEFARAVWNCTPLPAFAVNSFKKGLFGYR